MSRIASTSKISLEDYDALLSPLETSSIARIELANNQKTISPRLMRRFESESNKIGINSKSSRVGSPSSSPRPGSSLARFSPSSDPLKLSSPIETAQEFHDWFSSIQTLMERDQEQVYRLHLSQLDESIGKCNTILEDLEESRGLLSEMEANYKFVEENSKALQSACEQMLDEQKHLVEVSEAIATRLEYFKELENCTKMLNLPGETLVLQQDFLNLLDRLEICLDYLKMNRDFKDAEIYIIRFQQCLTRAMTLIKMYFVTMIRKVSNDVSEKMSGKDLSETALGALLYTKFTNVSTPLKILIFELEKRGKLEPNEYGALLSECYSTWFAARTVLLSGNLAEEVRRMDPVGTDLIKLARAGCNHLRSICMSEWSLYKELFSTGETELYQYLESLCDHLYDSIRPKILAEPKIETLCELCTVLSAMMALDSKSNFDDSDSEEEISIITDPFSPTSMKSENSTSKTSSVLGSLKFSLLLKVILEDVQTRLVFRAQNFILVEILYFIPTKEELNYPELLEKEVNIIMEREEGYWRDEDAGESGFRVPREEVQLTWFCTLKKTVWVLSKLHTYVNDAVFEDFAGEAVTNCRQSLSATSLLVAQQPGNSALDGQLFLIRHLLILKSMIRSVDLGRVERGVDFSSVTDALYNLLKNTSVILNPNALYALASKGIPNFGETMIDAKLDLDGALKKSCESFISDTASLLALPISNFLALCTTFLSSSTPKDLASQEFASPEAVIALHETIMTNLESEVGISQVVKKLKVYLTEEKTIKVLLPPLLEEIVQVYTTFYNLVRSEYDFSTSSSLTTPALLSEKLAISSI